MSSKNILIFMLFSTLLVSSCNTDDKKADVPDMKSEGIEKGNLKITNAWIRPGAAEMNTAFFFDVYNSSEISDTLIGVESDLAEIVEIHETFKKGEDMMGMRSVDAVEIPGGKTFQFKPMHNHIMLIKVVNDLKVGSEGIVKLNFKNAGMIEVKANVTDKKMMKH